MYGGVFYPWGKNRIQGSDCKSAKLHPLRPYLYVGIDL